MYVYERFHTLAGSPVRQSEIDRAEMEGNDCAYDQWVWVELTEEEANWWERQGSLYGRIVASTIRDTMERNA